VFCIGIFRFFLDLLASRYSITSEYDNNWVKPGDTLNIIRATASIKLNLTQIGHVGQEWGSDIMTDFSDNLEENTSNANAGSLVGNRMFFSNDYM
jgi:hypothetical protein